MAILKLLCDSCYESELFRTALEANVEERSERIIKLNKALREEQAKKREVSSAKREQAIEACRKINEANFKANPAGFGSGAPKNSRSKKAAPAPAPAADGAAVAAFEGEGQGEGQAGDSSALSAISAATDSAGAGAKAKEDKIKNPFDPTHTQLQTMLDDILMLDSKRFPRTAPRLLSLHSLIFPDIP